MSIVNNQIKSLVERIERVEDERKLLGEDLKDIYNEAKSEGFDTKVLKKIIAMRRRDAAEVQEEEAIMDLYLNALGMTPIERVIAGAAQ